MKSVVFPTVFTFTGVSAKRSTPAKKTKLQHIRSMRAVVQRVSSASVEVEGRVVSEIGPGLLILVGLHESDADADADFICRKALNMRVFPNENTGKAWDLSGNMSLISMVATTLVIYPEKEFSRGEPSGSRSRAALTVMQKNHEVLLVSQFTLYGTLKGNKPDFHVAMPPQNAKPFYASLVERFGKSYNPEKIKDGVFGAMMEVNLVNDGPVTIQLDSQSPK